MQYISTRNRTVSLPLSAAIQDGLALDGGLFVPERIPVIDCSAFSSELTYAEFAFRLLKVFFETDKLREALATICDNTFYFPIPLKQLADNTFVLELFHGPTSSFKDFGAQFLAECLNTITNCKKTILV